MYVPFEIPPLPHVMPPTDTMNGRIHVHTRFNPPYAEFVVSDTGVGIPGMVTKATDRQWYRLTLPPHRGREGKDL